MSPKMFNSIRLKDLKPPDYSSARSFSGVMLLLHVTDICRQLSRERLQKYHFVDILFSLSWCEILYCQVTYYC